MGSLDLYPQLAAMTQPSPTGWCQWGPGGETGLLPLYFHNYTLPKLGLPFVANCSDGCQPFLSQLPSRGGKFSPHHLNLDGFVINSMICKWGLGTSGLRPYNFYFCTEGNSTTYKEVQPIHKKREAPCGRPAIQGGLVNTQRRDRPSHLSQLPAEWAIHPSWGSRHEWLHLGFSSSSPSRAP